MRAWSRIGQVKRQRGVCCVGDEECQGVSDNKGDGVIQAADNGTLAN